MGGVQNECVEERPTGRFMSRSQGFSCAIEAHLRSKEVSTSSISGAFLIDIRELQQPQQDEEVGERDGREPSM